MTVNHITVPVLAGVVAPFVIAMLNRTAWSARIKTTVALGFYGIVTLGVLFAQSHPDKWRAFAGTLFTIFVAGQTAFTALKPSGLLDDIERSINPGKIRKKG